MTGGDKPGDASADKWRETFQANRTDTDLALTRLEIRAEQRSVGDEEDSAVIYVEAAKRVAERIESIPPSKASPAVIVLTVVRKFPAWGAVIVALSVVAAYVFLHSK